VIVYEATAQIAIAEAKNGTKMSAIRMRKSVSSVCAVPRATSKPVAFKRNPPPAKAAAMPSLTTHHQLLTCDSRRMDSIQNESVDLVVTSPPYPMIEMWDKTFSDLNSAISQELINSNPNSAYDLMHQELTQVWSEVVRALKPGGMACINIGDATRTIDGNFQLFPNHSHILESFLGLGMTSLPDIIWKKPTNAPNKYMGSGMLPAGAYVTLEHEYILVFRKGGKRDFNDSERKSHRRTSAFFWEERNKWFSDTWELKGASQKLNNQGRDRSAAFPLVLPHRIINMFSVIGDTVLDPFNGTGTTTKSAIANARNSIGLEIDDNFVETLKLDLADTKVGELASVNETRLADHQKFVESSKPDSFKYTNKHYDFPVKTRQEVELKLPELNSVRLVNSHIEARYK
jgi:DNA modification methylase